MNRVENKGIGFTLNELRKEILKWKSIELIRWLSADDKCYKDNVSIMVESYEQSGAKFIYSDWTMIDGNDVTIRDYALPTFQCHEDFCIALWNNCEVNGSTILIHKEVLEKIPFDESFRYGEDWLFFLMCARDYEFVHEVTPTVYYRTHDGQTTHDKMSEIPKNNVRIIEKVKVYWSDKDRKKDGIYMVNWISEINGGVESIFEDISSGLGGSRTISINNAYTTLKIPFINKGAYYRHAVFDRSFITSEYVNQHNLVFNPDFYICNDDICSFFPSEMGNVVMIFQNPYIDISNLLYRNRLVDINNFIEYNKMYPMLQVQGSKNATCRIAVSEYMKNVMERMGIPCDRVIPHGIDTDIFKKMDKEACRKKFGIETDKPVAVISTKFIPLKYHLIPHLVRQFPDIYWVINFANDIEGEAKLDNVKIIPPLSRDKMVEFYNCGDFGVFPSAVESFNLSAVECMACDIPIVVTKTGYFFENDKAVEFGVSSFVKAIKDRQFISDSPRQWVIDEKLTIDRMISDYKIVLKELKEEKSAT